MALSKLLIANSTTVLLFPLQSNITKPDIVNPKKVSDIILLLLDGNQKL